MLADVQNLQRDNEQQRAELGRKGNTGRVQLLKRSRELNVNKGITWLDAADWENTLLQADLRKNADGFSQDERFDTRI